MKSLFLTLTPIFVFLICNPISAQKDLRTVSGRVTHIGKPVQGVKISVVETNETTYTDRYGRYSLQARTKQTLAYSHPGFGPVEVIVEDVTRTLNIAMDLKILELDEVIVTEKKLSRRESLEQEYLFGKGVVKGAYGFVDKRSSALSLRIFEEEEIMRSMDLIDLIRRAVPGVWISRSRDTLIFPRFNTSLTGNSIPVGFDIDGSLTKIFPSFLLVQDIKRIAVIRSPQYGGYGRFAAGGLVIINTKTGEFSKTENGKPYDYAKLRNNIFNGDARPHGQLNQDSSEYGAMLSNAADREGAMSIFRERGKVFGSSPDFYFNTAAHFWNQRRDRESYIAILGETKRNFDDNANVLKVVAYRYEELGELNKANEVYRNILKLRPDYGQSYRDLANGLMKTGDEKAALGLVARYKKIMADFGTGEDTGAKSEIDSIMATEASAWVSSGKVRLENELKKGIGNEIWPIRLMVEWNNSDAEFDVQLVNPEGHYYTWSHTMEKNGEFIQNEKIRGFSSKQFYMGNEPPGKWQVNVKYFGNKSFDHTYLKVTAFTNYGGYDQSERSEVVKLSSKDINQKVMVVTTPISKKLSSN